MLEELASLFAGLDDESSLQVTMIAGSVAVAGAVLWLYGNALSRGLITLALVAIGTVAGLLVPDVMEWQVQSSATAMGGAVALGVSGFMLHHLFRSALLAMAAAGWVLVIAALAQGVDAHALVIAAQSRDIGAIGVALEQAVPAMHDTAVRLAAALAALGGVTLSLLRPRTGGVITWVLTGGAIMLAGTTVAMLVHHPHIPLQVGGSPLLQAGLIGTLLLGGIMIQSWLTLLAHPHEVTRAKPGAAQKTVEGDDHATDTGQHIREPD